MDANQPTDASIAVVDAAPPDRIGALDAAPPDGSAADAGPPSPSGLLYVDRFQQGQISEWMTARGRWMLCSHEGVSAFCPVGPALSALLVGEASWTDYEIEAKVVVLSDTPMSFMYIGFRAESPDRFYAFGVGRPYAGGSQWELGQANASGLGHNNGGPFHYHFGQPFLLRVRVQGKVATLYQQEWKDYNKRTDFSIKPVSVMRADLPAAGRIAIGAKGDFGMKLLSLKVTTILP